MDEFDSIDKWGLEARPGSMGPWREEAETQGLGIYCGSFPRATGELEQQGAGYTCEHSPLPEDHQRVKLHILNCVCLGGGV